MPLPPVDLTQFTNSRVLPLKDDEGKQLDVRPRPSPVTELTDAQIKQMITEPEWATQQDAIYAKLTPSEQARTQAIYNSTTSPFQKVANPLKTLMANSHLGASTMKVPGIGESAGAVAGGLGGAAFGPVAGIGAETAGGMLGNLADQSKVFSAESPSVMDQPFSVEDLLGAGIRQGALSGGSRAAGHLLGAGFNRAFGELPTPNARAASLRIEPSFWPPTAAKNELDQSWAAHRAAGNAVRKEVALMQPVTAKEVLAGFGDRLRKVSPGSDPVDRANAARAEAKKIYQQNFTQTRTNPDFPGPPPTHPFSNIPDYSPSSAAIPKTITTTKDLPALEALLAYQNTGKSLRVAKLQGLDATPAAQVDSLFTKNISKSLTRQSPIKFPKLNLTSEQQIELKEVLDKEGDPSRYLARRALVSGIGGALGGGEGYRESGPSGGLYGGGLGAMAGLMLGSDPVVARNIARVVTRLGKGTPTIVNASNAANQINKTKLRRPK